MHYAANLELAVQRIVRDVSYKSLIRNAHVNGASMLFIAVCIHMVRGRYYRLRFVDHRRKPEKSAVIAIILASDGP